MIYVDVGYISFKWAMASTKDELLDRLMRNGATLCFDSDHNMRMAKYPWYKANRGDKLPPVTQELKKIAKKWQAVIRERYTDQCITYHGLEGDDVIAMAIKDCPTAYVMTEDHDMLQLECAYLVNQHMEPWSVTRLKQKTLFLLQGERYLTYQLLHGCTTDTVPRTIFSKDRYTAPWVFAQPSPLRAALMLLPEDLARQSLDVLLLPTPLFWERDSIEVALERYPEQECLS